MSWIERLNEEGLRELLIDGVEELVVFTGRSNQTQNLNSNWSYEIVGKNSLYEDWFTVKKTSGWTEFCSCEECVDFGTELYEHFSVLQALIFIRENFPSTPVSLNVKSRRFMNDAREGFYDFESRYYCHFLNGLITELFNLIWDLGLIDNEPIYVFQTVKNGQ